jgi:hypothetical protein
MRHCRYYKGERMVTIEQIISYIETRIAESRMAGDAAALRKIQSSAGFLMEAANAAGDKETGKRLQILAAKAANEHEALQK